MGYEWKDFQGFTTLGNLDEIQKMMAELMFEPEQFQGRIIFMSRHNVTFWEHQEMKENCFTNFVNVATYARRFPNGCWSYMGPYCEKMWYGTMSISQMEQNC